MSDVLDNRVVSLMMSMLNAGSTRSDIELVKRLWKERALAADALIRIRDWDLMHSMARSGEIVDDIVDRALAEIGE